MHGPWQGISGANARTERRVDLMEHFLQQHFTEALDVPTIARAAGVHPQYASALFRQHRGYPLVEALARQRVRHAQSLLAGTDATVLDVALTSGFQSLSRFYAAFQRFAGQSPRQFRASARSGEAAVARSSVLHILWIDDQPLNNVAERRLLAEHGLFTDAYTDNRSAMRAFESAPFDAVISDIHRGRESETGWDLLRNVRSQHQGLPFFFYTGSSDARLRWRAERASALGAYDRSRELLDALLRTCPKKDCQA